MYSRSTLCGLLACLCLQAPQAHSKTAEDYLTEVKDYAAAPLHWDAEEWQWAAGATAAVASAYALDNRVRERFADAQTRPTGDPHSLRDAAPTIALTLGTLAFGALRHDEPTYRTGYDMVEAVGLGSLSAFVLKNATGRARPDSTTDRAAWGTGGDSFPSGHVTAAFAAAEVFAESRPPDEWRWRILAYSLACATAYARVNGNMHWTSDTVAGAALGIATGRFVAARGDEKWHSHVSAWIQPLPGGAMLSFSVDPR